jgi:hypothetical protein
MEKPILKKLNELEYHYTLLEEEVKMNYDTRNILNLIHETRSLVEKLTIPNVSNCDSDTKDLIEHTKRVLDLIKSKSGMAVKVLSNRVNKKLEQIN